MKGYKADCENYMVILNIAHCLKEYCAGKIFCDDSCYEKKTTHKDYLSDIHRALKQDRYWRR